MKVPTPQKNNSVQIYTTFLPCCVTSSGLTNNNKFAISECNKFFVTSGNFQQIIKLGKKISKSRNTTQLTTPEEDKFMHNYVTNTIKTKEITSDTEN